MGNSVVKFSLRAINETNESDSHWDYCCKNRIPHITIRNSGIKYWKVSYDILCLTMFERFAVLGYTDYTIPFYSQYCTDVNFPTIRKAYSGSGGSLIFTVFKKDAPAFAEKLFDLLLQLSIKDQELFDKDPFYINEEGFNSEGFHVTGYLEELKEMSENQLIREYSKMKKNKPFWKQTIQLIENEINQRKINQEHLSVDQS